jgi:hypothetical protein
VEAVPSTAHDGALPRISVFYGIVVRCTFTITNRPISMLNTRSVMR